MIHCMHVFLLLLFPLSIAVWLKGKNRPLAPGLLNAFLGIFLAAVFCAFKYFFSPYYFLTPDSFWRNFLHLFVEQTFAPLAVLTAAFSLLYKKDKLAVRLDNIFPFYAGFYAVFLPFRILGQSLPHPPFMLLGKPLMFALMLVVMTERQKALFVPYRRALLSAREAAFVWFSFAFTLLTPASTEALWILGMGPLSTVALVVLYAANSLVAVLQALSRESDASA